MNQVKKVLILIGVLVGIFFVLYLLQSKGTFEILNPGSVEVESPEGLGRPLDGHIEQERGKEIVSPAGFINTDSITVQELVGKKVVMIDFWTFSCINCQRTLPFITSWYDKYRDEGLEIIGVHTPEFAFEKEYNNVLDAVKKWEIEYPVVLDNDYATWRNYKNRYWPRKYLIDIYGNIVYDHIGEGAYDETEKIIQKLLAERKIVLNEAGTISGGISNPQNVETVDSSMPRSHETYFGSLRNSSLENGAHGRVGVQSFEAPHSPKTGVLYLDGEWDIQPEFAKSKEGGSKIVFRYQAQKVFLVMSADEKINVTLFLDGQDIGHRAGRDVSESSLSVENEQLYRLIEDDTWGEHTLEIISETPGLKVYAFTFG